MCQAASTPGSHSAPGLCSARFHPDQPYTSDVTSSQAVHAIIPLSLLEAMRNLDTPIDDGLAELAHEMVSKRLGLSSTVATQIERYRSQAERQGSVSMDEAVSVFRLVSRREDAQLVFADAGRRTARLAAHSAPTWVRTLLKAGPRVLRQRVGVRAVGRVAARVLDAEVSPQGGGLAEARLTESIASRASATGPGCYYYGAAFAELLRLLSGFEGAMLHERCRAKGDPDCTWRSTTVEGYE